MHLDGGQTIVITRIDNQYIEFFTYTISLYRNLVRYFVEGSRVLIPVQPENIDRQIEGERHRYRNIVRQRMEEIHRQTDRQSVGETDRQIDIDGARDTQRQTFIQMVELHRDRYSDSGEIHKDRPI